MVKKITLSADGINQSGFLKVSNLNCLTKGAIPGSFRRASCPCLLLLKNRKTKRFKQITVSTDKIHQNDFLKANVLNHSTKGAMTESFRR